MAKTSTSPHRLTPLQKLELGTALTLLLAIVGFAFWLGKLEARLDARGTDLKEQRDKVIEDLKDAAASLGVARAFQVPIGTVVAFWGKKDEIPKESYEICDGEVVSTRDSPIAGKKKPDLRDCFIKGAAQTADDVVTNKVQGGHNTISERVTGGFALRSAEMPAHSHDIEDEGHIHQTVGDALWDKAGNAGEKYILTFKTVDANDIHNISRKADIIDKAKTNIKVVEKGDGKAHSHSIPEHDNRPAYVELFYIIRVR
jgi:hypothetical protein